MTTHLVIPDPHVKMGVSNNRFIWAAKFANEVKPDVIICLGDWVNMDSLSHFDRGKKAFEGRRYNREIEHAEEALYYFNKYFKVKKCIKIMLEGNHEYRITKFVEDNPELDGKLSVGDIPFEEYGWEVHEYERIIEIDGILYCHNIASGVMGKPISGDYVASNLLKKNFQSATVGHSHLFDYAIRSMHNGRKIMGLNAGCYLHHKESFAKGTQRLWWSGLIVKRNVDKGEYDLETINIKELKNRYENRK